MNRLPRLDWMNLAARRPRRPPNRRRSLNLRPWLQALEDRLVLSTITWDSANQSTGGDWDKGSNWIGGKAPGPSDTAVIKGLTSPGIIYLNSNATDSVLSLTTDSTTDLRVITGSLSLGAASSSTLGGPVTIVQGASMSVGAGTSVRIASTLTDDGTLTFGSSDTVSLYAAQIAVDGKMTTTTGDSFTNVGYTSTIVVNSGGELAATSTTFSIS